MILSIAYHADKVAGNSELFIQINSTKLRNILRLLCRRITGNKKKSLPQAACGPSCPGMLGELASSRCQAPCDGRPGLMDLWG